MPASNNNTYHANGSQATLSSRASSDSQYSLKAKIASSQPKSHSGRKQLTTADLKKSLHSQASEFYRHILVCNH